MQGLTVKTRFNFFSLGEKTTDEKERSDLEEAELNFKKVLEKFFVFLVKMKFSIREDDQEEKQIFFSFQQASDKTGIPSETLSEVFQKLGRGRYFRRADKKTFWIYDEDYGMPFIRIKGEDFSDVDSVRERFGVHREDAIYQLCQETMYFYDSQGRDHQISWKSSSLEALIDALKHAQMTEKALNDLPPKGTSQEKARSLIEEIETMF